MPKTLFKSLAQLILDFAGCFLGFKFSGQLKAWFPGLGHHHGSVFIVWRKDSGKASQVHAGSGDDRREPLHEFELSHLDVSRAVGVGFF